jgi:hypothetical protein
MLGRACDENGERRNARETKRDLARQPGVSGRCTPMLACQREFDAPRHPLTSFYPTPAIPGYPPSPRSANTDATAGVGQTEISSFEKWIGPPLPLRSTSFVSPWNCFLVTHLSRIYRSDFSSCNLSFAICVLLLWKMKDPLNRFGRYIRIMNMIKINIVIDNFRRKM